MTTITEKQVLLDAQARIVRMRLIAPDIARHALPGQFVVLMVGPEGERIPLTIVGTDNAQGTITLIFQEAGYTTRLLGRQEVGGTLFALTGPLGHPTQIASYGTVVVIGGGVGIAEILPVASALKKAGNRVVTIIGARTKAMLILEEELRAVSDELLIATDDGSCGTKGFTVDVLRAVLAPAPGRSAEKVGLVYAVGPIPMMRAVAEATRTLGVRTMVSLNALMVDATGMCGCCRVSVAGGVRFACIDGPEFDAHQVDWNEFAERSRMYERQEKHVCRLLAAAEQSGPKDRTEDDRKKGTT